MTDNNRSTWLKTARRLGIDVSRGETVESIKGKIQQYDEQQYRAVVGDDAPSAKRRGRD